MPLVIMSEASFLGLYSMMLLYKGISEIDSWGDEQTELSSPLINSSFNKAKNNKYFFYEASCHSLHMGYKFEDINDNRTCNFFKIKFLQEISKHLGKYILIEQLVFSSSLYSVFKFETQDQPFRF